MFRAFTSLARTVPRLVKVASPVINQAFVHNLAAAATVIPRVQQVAPDFKGTAVILDQFKDISLADYKGKYVVLVFYPLDFTFVCPTELIAFNDKYDDFQKLNTEVIGISVDSQYTHLGWMNTKRAEGGLGKLKYPLLSDLKKNIARDYNVLLENEGIALRGLFVIDPNSVIRHMAINDLPIGRSVDETIRIIEALRFVEEHGEVCPANWQKGGKTIKPDPKGSKEYFESTNKERSI